MFYDSGLNLIFVESPDNLQDNSERDHNIED